MKTSNKLKSIIFLIAGFEGIQSANSMQISSKVKDLPVLSGAFAFVSHPNILQKNNQIRHYSHHIQHSHIVQDPLWDKINELKPIKDLINSDLADFYGQEKYDLKDIQFFVYCKEALNYNLYSGADIDNLISICLQEQKNQLKYIEKNEDMEKAIEWLEITKLNLYHSVKDLNHAREGIKYITENYEEAKYAPEIRIRQYCKHLLSESHNLRLTIERYKNFDERTKKYIYDNLLFLCYDLIKKLNAFDSIYKTFLARDDQTKLVTTQDNLDPTTFRIIEQYDHSKE